MTTTTVRKTATATVATALLGLGSFLAPAAAQAQINPPAFPVEPSDILKIDTDDLTVDVQGNTANFTATAPENMACIGPLVVEGSISESDIDPENYDQRFFDDLFDNPVWPTNESDLHVVVTESSELLQFPNATQSPADISASGLSGGDYVATSLCVSEDYVDVPTLAGQIDGPGQLSALQNTQFPMEVHFRNFSIGSFGSVDLGSVDAFGSLGSLGS